MEREPASKYVVAPGVLPAEEVVSAGAGQVVARDIHRRTADGGLELDFHPGQWSAWDSRRRFVGVLAGTQGGKTSWGPWWLHREIYDPAVGRGAGDYLAVTATFDLFKLKMLPALRQVFEDVTRCGRYWPSARVMELADPEGRYWARRADDPMWGRIILRSADSPGGLESASARGAWLDEAGQDRFTLDAWRAVTRRLALSLGRCLITTTLYNFGWLKTEFYDRWKGGDPEYDVVHFDSTVNPSFPASEWGRARETMPSWLFDMTYRGLFDRPAGWIYDCFLDAHYPEGHLVERFPVPGHWPRYVGMDFGGTNTAAVLFAFDPEARVLYAYREYRGGKLTAAGHARNVREGEPDRLVCVGGSGSEQQWRDEFNAAGLYVYPPDTFDVEVGIARTYGGIKAGRVYFFDDLATTLRMLRGYSRQLDAAGLATDEIKDKKLYHELDAVRYLLGWLFSPARVGPGVVLQRVGPGNRWGSL